MAPRNLAARREGWRIQWLALEDARDHLGFRLDDPDAFTAAQMNEISRHLDNQAQRAFRHYDDARKLEEVASDAAN